MHIFSQAKYSKVQQGISLLTVLIIVLLSALLVLGASKSALFNEVITGNDSDYQRTVEAAQLLVRDAELDIKGYRDDKTPCRAGTGFIGCRSVSSNLYFPVDGDQYSALINQVSMNAPRCAAGLCANLCPNATVGFCNGDTPRFWATPTMLASMTPLAATYGQFTQATPASGVGNTILTSGRGWYWVEILQYTPIKFNVGQFSPNIPQIPYIYRITAVAQGNKPGTQAVIQTIISLRNPN